MPPFFAKFNIPFCHEDLTEDLHLFYTRVWLYQSLKTYFRFTIVKYGRGSFLLSYKTVIYLFRKLTKPTKNVTRKQRRELLLKKTWWYGKHFTINNRQILKTGRDQENRIKNKLKTRRQLYRQNDMRVMPCEQNTLAKLVQN